MYAEQMLKCTRCNNLKSESEFYNYKHEHRCKSCMKEMRKETYQDNSEIIIKRVRKYSQNNIDKVRNTKLKQTYKLSKSEYDIKFAEQKGLCAICHKPEKTVWKGKLVALAVDHNHSTGANRDLLCMKCNRALGLLDESISNLESMIDYIKKHLK